MKLLSWLQVKQQALLFNKKYFKTLYFNNFFYFCTVFLPNAEMMDKNFDLFIPDDANATDAQKKEWSEMLRKFYFDGKALTSDSKDQFTLVNIKQNIILLLKFEFCLM